MTDHDILAQALSQIRAHPRFSVLLEMLELGWRIHDANSRCQRFTLAEQDESAQTRELMEMVWSLLKGEQMVRPVMMAARARLALVKGDGG